MQPVFIAHVLSIKTTRVVESNPFFFRYLILLEPREVAIQIMALAPQHTIVSGMVFSET